MAETTRVRRSPAHSFLGRNGALGRFEAFEAMRLGERGLERGLDFTRELAHKDGAVLLPQVDDEFVEAVPLDKRSPIWVDVAYSSEDTEQVELHDRLGVPKLLHDTTEEHGLGNANGYAR